VAKKTSGIYYGQRNKQRGQSDLETLIKLRNHIFKKWKIRWIKREWYLCFEDEHLIKWTENPTKEDVKQYKIRNPDLLLWSKKFGLLVIEVDGAVHDRKVSKTLERNDQYRKANIKFIVANLADLKFQKQNINDYIDEQISIFI